MTVTKAERTGWYFYDWANSAFYTTVITVFLGPYLTSITKSAADSSGYVQVIGIPVYADSLFAYTVSLSVALQVIILPLFGAIADTTNYKKTILGISAYIGAIATTLMFFLEGTRFLLGSILFIIANISFGVSVIIYNSYLNEIAEPENRDKISANGWAFGYLGGGILLALNLLLFSQKDKLGITTDYAVRICLCSAGLWWGIFTIIPLLTLKNRKQNGIKALSGNIVYSGFRQLFKTIRDARKYPVTLLFLLSFIFYNEGIQTIIVISSLFGHEELGIPFSTLTQIILMVQFIAFLGSLFYKFVLRYLSVKNTIIISLFIWLSIIVYTYRFLTGTTDFFILAACIALVLGGTQAMSRSFFSNMIPLGYEAEYFSLYEISDRGTSWLGPLIFGLSLQLTGSYRYAMLSLGVFIAIGLALLFKVKESELK
ncbi:MAG: Permease of the major facilitator superfamily-like protein [Ignavibacteria bacterium]|nr:Permease of the major facilitator superfamily-like protein [Ignavibacteria bacterium]